MQPVNAMLAYGLLLGQISGCAENNNDRVLLQLDVAIPQSA